MLPECCTLFYLLGPGNLPCLEFVEKLLLVFPPARRNEQNPIHQTPDFLEQGARTTQGRVCVQVKKSQRHTYNNVRENLLMTARISSCVWCLSPWSMTASIARHTRNSVYEISTTGRPLPASVNALRTCLLSSLGVIDASLRNAWYFASESRDRDKAMGLDDDSLHDGVSDGELRGCLLFVQFTPPGPSQVFNPGAQPVAIVSPGLIIFKESRVDPLFWNPTHTHALHT